MVEYKNGNLRDGIKYSKANVVGFTKDESPNYAGKERIQSGVAHGGWNVRTWIGDRRISDETTYLKL